MDSIDLISAERLKTYSNFTDGRKKAIALHNQTLQLGSSIMSMIAVMELGLRNSTNNQLVEDFGDPDWLLPEHTAVPIRRAEQPLISKAHNNARRAVYSKLTYKEKSALDDCAFPYGKPEEVTHKQEVKARQRTLEFSHGQVIAEMTFVFWKRLYSREYDATLWKPSLKKVFPNKKLRRSEISDALESIYVARNRVAHHEPMYGGRLAKTMTAIKFIRNSLGAKSAEEDTAFKQFSNVRFLRLQMDHAAFRETWETLT